MAKGGGRGRLSNLLSKQIHADKQAKLKKQKSENKELHYSKNAKKLQNKIRREQTDPSDVYDERKVFVPFAKTDRVLVVGDGDFSYSLCVIHKGLVKPKNLIATSYDTLEELKEKYGAAVVEENVGKLNDAGVMVHHGIDATKLCESLGMSLGNKRVGSGAGKSMKALGGLRINNIVFNFPHLGSSIKNVERNVLMHQKFMFAFFKSCEEFYRVLDQQKEWTNYKEPAGGDDEDEDGGEIVDEAAYFRELMNRKKSAPEDKNVITVTLFEGEPYDSWKIKRTARDAIAYCVQRSGRFEWPFFEGYEHKRTAGLGETNKVSRTRAAKIYKFERFQLSERQALAKEKKKQLRNGEDGDSD